MSLVDTVCIGQFASTAELAALGPNTLIFNFFTYVMTALCIATVTVVAEKLRQDNIKQAGRALSGSLFVAAAIGCLVTAVLQLFGRPIMLATGCAPAILQPALTYLRIRAWAAPAVLLLMVAQSGLLAQKDSFTPLLGVLVQCGLNVAGDIALITYYGQGVAGAAWATALSQYVGAAGLLWALQRTGKAPLALAWPQRDDLAQLSASCGPLTLAYLLRNSCYLLLQDLRGLAATMGPATVIYLCKNTCYLMLQGAATALTPLLVAAHQPVWVVWNLFAFCHTPLEQAALAFLPAAADRREAIETTKVLLAVGVSVGVATALGASGIPTLRPQLFSTDAALWPVMRSVAPQGFLAMLLTGIDVAANGILMANKDLHYIARAMAINLAVLAAYLALASKWSGWSLGGVWWGLVLFFGMRALQSTARLALTVFNDKHRAYGNLRTA
ncbi:hypothetical protein WJX72_012538 [[Myrmecia] bisecta]|uniref:MATE efflux family protein n=1 Tax=[Myrmecia] bisecta TaxID=41462 RepID=A0AAW1RA88_9CHLO